jgi:hypothetical protein
MIQERHDEPLDGLPPGSLFDPLPDARTPPWRRDGRPRRPSRWTLARWRSLANKRARERGARWACDLCKRPIGNAAAGTGCYGQITLTVPGAWRQRPLRRRICFDCWTLARNYVEMCEAEGAGDRLEAEVIEG